MKYALVTGCDHGLGLSLAKQLTERGYITVACYFQEQPEEYAGHLVQVDISSDQSVECAKKALENMIPCLDLLINNAGILGDMEDGPDQPLDYDLMQRVMNVNAIGTLRMIKAMLPLLRRGTEKTIVNISSEAGSIADCERTGWFGYCMSKAANNMQGTLIHNSFRGQGGRVFQIHPGHVATYMRGHLDTTAKITPEESAKGILNTVLDRDWPVQDRPLYLDYMGKELPW